MKITIDKSWDGSQTVLTSNPIIISFELISDTSSVTGPNDTNERKDQIIQIKVDAPYFGCDHIPPFPAKCRCPELWKYEVVEIFIASPLVHGEVRSTPYLEIIIGPHSHWLLLQHSGQDNWSECNDQVSLDNDLLPLEIYKSYDAKRWYATMCLPLSLLPAPEAADTAKGCVSSCWLFNAFAIHNIQTERTAPTSMLPLNYLAGNKAFPYFNGLSPILDTSTPINTMSVEEDHISDADIHNTNHSSSNTSDLVVTPTTITSRRYLAYNSLPPSDSPHFHQLHYFTPLVLPLP